MENLLEYYRKDEGEPILKGLGTIVIYLRILPA